MGETKRRPCKCIAKVNAHIKERGLCLSIGCLVNMKTGKSRESTYMTTERLERGSRVKRNNVYPTFCPFCGERLQTS